MAPHVDVYLVPATGLLVNPLNAQVKIESLLWKLIVDYSNFQNMVQLFKSEGCDFFFLLVRFGTFLELPEMIYLNSY